MKKILLFVIIPFFGFSQTQIGVDIDGENSGDASGTSVSISSNGNTDDIRKFSLFLSLT